MALNSYYKTQLARLDRQLESMYNDPDALTEGELATKTASEQYDAISSGKVLYFEEDPVKYEKWALRIYAKGQKQIIFKHKDFYYISTGKKEALIFAVHAKNTETPLLIPKKLGSHTVVGLCDFKLSRGDGYGKWRNIDFTEPPQDKKAAIYGILSFPNLQGHEALATTHLHDMAEEVKIAPTVKSLMMAILPNARVLHLPSTLTYLGPLCAPKLERVEIYDCGIPAEACVIHSGAFGLCTALTYLTLPSGTEYLPNGLLFSASGLQYLHIPAAVKDIGKGLISRAKELKMLQVDGMITKGHSDCNIETAMICGNSYRHFSGNIKQLTLTGELTKLSNLPVTVEQLTLPDNLCGLERSALENQKNLRSLTLPNGITEIGSYAFCKCGITELVLPDSIQELGFSAFANCTALVRLKLPAALQKLDSRVFDGCTALKELVLPDGVTEICCRMETAKTLHIDDTTWIDLRPLGKATAIDPLLRVHLTAEEGTPAAVALATYRRTLAENIAQNISAIAAYLALSKRFLVTAKNLDHITAAIRYLAAVDPQNTTLLPKLTAGFATFFRSVAEKTSVEKDFVYINYFYDTLQILKQYGAKEAYDLLQEGKLALFDRIATSTKHALKGTKLLAENTPKAREDALVELVRAYHIYPRSIPVLISLIHWFASDKYLYDTKAPEKFLKFIRQWQGDNDDGVDYIAKAEDLLRTLREAHRFKQDTLTKEEKRELYFHDLHQIDILNSAKHKPYTLTTTETSLLEDLTTPRHLSFQIDEAFFAEIRQEVRNRTAGSFGSTLEYGNYAKEQKLFAVDMAEAIIFPKKRAAVEKRIADSKEEAARKWREEQERIESAIAAAQAAIATKTASSYTPSTSYSDDTDYATYPYSSQYPYSYNNPYSPVTDTAHWAHAEAIGIEWDIIDRDYYLDLGIFGDHSL